MKSLKNEKGSALLFATIVGIAVAFTAIVTIYSTSNTINKMSIRREKLSAFNIAESGKEHALAELRSGTFTPAADSMKTIFASESFDQGTYLVQCSANALIDTLWIYSLGVLENQNTQIDVICAMNISSLSIDLTIEAAVTTRSSISTLGNITIDGRDWDSTGTSVVDDGVLGIKSCGTLNQSGNSKIGGNGNEPIKNASAPIVDHLVSPDGYPTTPEEILGLPEGSLDSYKTSTLPSMPFNGIVYYTPSGSFNCPNFQNSSGIFICHNDSMTATVKNIDGDFKGIIISDRVDHVNAGAEILGAVVTLSEVEGTNAFGNGNADIKYSSQILTNLCDSITVDSDTTIEVVSWQQR